MIQILSFQSSILARFQNYSKLEETQEEMPEFCLDSRTREAKKDKDLLGPLASDPGEVTVEELS